MDNNEAQSEINIDNTSDIECPLTEQEPGLSFMFLLTHLHWLLYKPGDFFSGFNTKLTTFTVVFVAYLMGIISSSDRFDTLFERSITNGASNSAWISAAQSWGYYWSLLLLTGILTGAIAWFFWGWIFNLRVKWSGAKDVDPTHGRNVYMIANIVYSLPTFFFLLLVTLQFPDYQTYYFWPDYYWPVLVVFVFAVLSYFTQYFAVQRLFDVIRWKAIIFFIAIPIVFNVTLITIYVMAQS